VEHRESRDIWGMHDPAMEDCLAAYADLVRAYADRLDLVAPGDLDRFEERHIRDSLRPLALLRSLPDGPCADVGSGAGLPGVPLAIAEPNREWRLIEPRRRRAAFLEEVVRALDLRGEVVVVTADAARRDPRLAAAHALAIARALAPPAHALAMIVPLVAPGGAAAVFLGEEAEAPPGSEEVEEGLAIVRVD
jgi:16S rRNA (guanine527-N7)-methyltransferase